MERKQHVPDDLPVGTLVWIRSFASSCGPWVKTVTRSNPWHLVHGEQVVLVEGRPVEWITDPSVLRLEDPTQDKVVEMHPNITMEAQDGALDALLEKATIHHLDVPPDVAAMVAPGGGFKAASSDSQGPSAALLRGYTRARAKVLRLLKEAHDIEHRYIDRLHNQAELADIVRDLAFRAGFRAARAFPGWVNDTHNEDAPASQANLAQDASRELAKWLDEMVYTGREAELRAAQAAGATPPTMEQDRIAVKAMQIAGALLREQLNHGQTRSECRTLQGDVERLRKALAAERGESGGALNDGWTFTMQWMIDGGYYAERWAKTFPCGHTWTVWRGVAEGCDPDHARMTWYMGTTGPNPGIAVHGALVGMERAEDWYEEVHIGEE